MLLASAPVLKYILLFLLVMVEGPLATMTAGFLAFEGYMNIALAYGLIVCAELVGDSLYYAIGFWGREKMVKRFGGYLHVPWSKFQKWEDRLHRHQGKFLILGKLTHFAGVPILVSSGLAKIRFSKFILYNFIATLPKSFVFLYLGYTVGKAIGAINRYLEYGTFVTGALILLLFVGYLFLSRSLEETLLSPSDERKR